MISEGFIYFMAGAVSVVALMVISSIVIHYRNGTLFVNDMEGEQK